MNINSLIHKYGETGQHNGANLSVFVDEERLSFYKKEPGFKSFTGIRLCAVLIKEQVLDTDIFLINNLKYRVFKSKEIRKNGVRIYSDALLFEDDFIHELEIFKQSLDNKCFNLPSIKAGQAIRLKGSIMTTRHNEYLQYALHSNKTPTHTISVLFDGSDIQITDLIKWGSRSFEILGFENINEQNRILVISVIEVLNG